jgi:TonB family protein
MSTFVIITEALCTLFRYHPILICNCRKELKKEYTQMPIVVRGSLFRIVPIIVLASLLFNYSAIFAGDARKIKSSTPPEYPELAKRLNLTGTARVEAVIAPDGTVQSVKELGGNPVLVAALVQAVKKWKYEPSDKTSVLEVKVDFASRPEKQ